MPLSAKLRLDGCDFTGTLTVADLEETLRVPPVAMKGFLIGKVRATAALGALDLDMHLNNLSVEEFKTSLGNAIAKFTAPPEVRTPLTREGILLWAAEVAEKRPTHTKEVWNEEAKEHEDKEFPTTANTVLTWVLLNFHLNNFSVYSKSELLDTLKDWMTAGQKGFDDYNADELLDEIWSEMCDPENATLGLVDLEDFVEHTSIEDE